MKSTDLNKSIDKALATLASQKNDISAVAKLAIIHAMPKRYGDESHGDTRPVNRLISGLIEHGAQTWASAILWYVKDQYPVFKVTTNLDKWSIALVENHKEIQVDTMVKTHGEVSPASYERVLTDEQKAKKAQAQDNAKKTREDKKAQAERDRQELEQLRAQNKVQKARIDELTERLASDAATVALGKAQDRLKELESILKASEDARANLRASCDKNDARIKGMEGVISAHVETIKQHVAEIAALKNVVAEMRVVKPSKTAKAV